MRELFRLLAVFSYYSFSVLYCSQSPYEPSISITANNSKIEQVQHFNYLGYWLTSNAWCEKERKRHINLAKSSFNSMKNIFRDRKLSIHLKTRLLKCFVWSVLMHGCETWTLTAKIRKNIEAAEMWFYRRILHIPWTALQTNETVLQKMGHERKLLCCIEQRQIKFLGHAKRKGELEDLESVQGMPGVSHLLTTLGICTKILDNYWMLPEIEQTGKTL